jgi:hypothetical protein
VRIYPDREEMAVMVPLAVMETPPVEAQMVATAGKGAKVVVGAAFITLRMPRLRACIAGSNPIRPAPQVIQEMAVTAGMAVAAARLAMAAKVGMAEHPVLEEESPIMERRRLITQTSAIT